MARNRTRGERQQYGSWRLIYDDERAVLLLNSLHADVAREVYNTFGYIGEVLRARLAAALPAAGESFPDTNPKYRGRATGKARASVTYTRSGNQGNFTRASKIRVSIHPKARYAYMLGYGWREREIKVGGSRVRSLDVRARVATAKGVRRRIIAKGMSGGYKRRHHLTPHAIAPAIVASYQGWIEQQVTDAVTRGTREAMDGAGA